MAGPRRYRYVGPADVAAAALRTGVPGTGIRSPGDLADTGDDPHTYVVDTAGLLRLAPRRSEHVACAAGGEVLAAGEITVTREPDGWTVTEVSNQSTGYCPEPSCWPAVAAALDAIGVAHPGGFTAVFDFRRCPACGQLSIVKEGDFTCPVCATGLPRAWNADPGTPDPA